MPDAIPKNILLDKPRKEPGPALWQVVTNDDGERMLVYREPVGLWQECFANWITKGHGYMHTTSDYKGPWQQVLSIAPIYPPVFPYGFGANNEPS